MKTSSKILVAATAIVVTLAGLGLYAVSVIEPKYLEFGGEPPAPSYASLPIEPDNDVRTFVETPEEMWKMLDSRLGFDVLAVEVCGSFYYKIMIPHYHGPFSMRLDVRDADSERVVGTQEIWGTLGGIVDPPQRFDEVWVQNEGPIPKRVRVVAFLYDKARTLTALPGAEIVAAKEVQRPPAPVPLKGSDLDILFEHGTYQMLRGEGEDERRMLEVRIPVFLQATPTKQVAWPLNVGFGAVVEGLDKDGQVVFGVRVGKSDSEDIRDTVDLGDKVAKEDCDRVVQLRISSDPCLAMLGRCSAGAWTGVIYVAVTEGQAGVRGWSGRHHRGEYRIEPKWVERKVR